MALQKQAAFDEGEFTFGSNKIGITDITIGIETSEIDVSDTETTSGESEFIFSKTSRTISFTGFHKVGTKSLELKDQKPFQLKIFDEDGGYDIIYGQCTLSEKTLTGSRDGAMTWAYTGRIQGAMNESSS